MKANEMTWRRVDHGVINEPLIDYLEKLIEIEQEKGNKVKICIGTDSQKKGKAYKFATAILCEVKEPMGMVYGKMTYIGRGAKVISGVFLDRTPMKIQARMLKEVQLSIDVGYNILPLLELYEIEFEIHADVNPDPKAGSNVALEQSVGYIKAMGFTCKIKPFAYAASSGADRLCNG